MREFLFHLVKVRGIQPRLLTLGGEENRGSEHLVMTVNSKVPVPWNLNVVFRGGHRTDIISRSNA
jgi:hypothetical protein